MNIKKTYLLFLVVISLTNQSAPLHTKALTTLTAWTKKCFNALPEYAHGFVNHNGHPEINKPINTPLQEHEIKLAIHHFITNVNQSDLNKKEAWINKIRPLPIFFGTNIFNTNKKHPDEFMHPYVQKRVVPAGAHICFMGDIHGSLHSLLRNLWRLVALKKLDNNFKITDPNFYIIFLGDLVDRGRYGIETWYTILNIKLANFDRVFMLRGNHETVRITKKYGFYTELEWTKRASHFKGKFVKKGIYKDILGICRLLPHALFLGSGNAPDFVQCSHGGIVKNTEFTKLLNTDWHNGKGARYQRVKEYKGLNWSDFAQMNVQSSIQPSKRTSHAWCADVRGAKKYLKNTNLKAIFRGHQDKSFGCKMFFNPTKYQKLKDQKIIFKHKKRRSRIHLINTGQYKNGPYHWKYIVSKKDQKRKDGFAISTYLPIFTLSSATEGQRLNYDCFGILTTAKTFDKWRLKIYETRLGKARNHAYVHLEQVNNAHVFEKIKEVRKDELIKIIWTTSKEGSSISASI